MTLKRILNCQFLIYILLITEKNEQIVVFPF
jgi:hypothetical protein